MSRLAAAALLLLALAACGSRRDLRPADSQSLPPAPYGAEAPPTPGELIAPTTQQRPDRSDELLQDSREREPDPFDLPPSR